MNKQKIYRDTNNNCVHIGEWDFMPKLDENGNEIITNPIPDGVISAEAEIIVGWDGGLYVSGDPRAQKQV